MKRFGKGTQLCLALVTVSLLILLMMPTASATFHAYKGDIPIVWNRTPSQKPCFDFWGVFVSGPKDTSIHDLDFDKDAKDMYDMLDSFPHWDKNVNERLRLCATWVQVQQDIEWLKQKADNDDVVVFYYAGHGIRIDDTDAASSDEPLNEIRQDNTICDYVSPGPSPMDEGIHLDEDVTDDQLGQAFAGGWDGDNIGIILIFDSCFSGGMIDGGKDPGATLTNNIYIILMAAARNWLSYSRLGPPPQNGEFTHYLLEGLAGLKADKNGDNILTAEELFDYADPLTRASVGNLNEDTDKDTQVDEDPLDLLNNDGDSWVDENGNGCFDWDEGIDEVWLDNDGSGDVTFPPDIPLYNGSDGVPALNGTALLPLFNEDPPDTESPSKAKNKDWEHIYPCVGGEAVSIDLIANKATLPPLWITPVTAFSTVFAAASIATLYKRRRKARKPGQ